MRGITDDEVQRVLKYIRKTFKKFGKLESADFYFEYGEYHIAIYANQLNEWYDCFYYDCPDEEVQGDE